MTPYLSLFNVRFRALLQYRAAAFAGFGTQLFWGLMRVMVFTAFFQASSASQPMTLDQTIAYIWLGQAFLLLVPYRGLPELVEMVRSGDVAYELARPVDLYWIWFVRSAASRAAPLLLRCVPMLMVAGLFLSLPPPASPGAALAFGASLLLALLLSAAFMMLMTVTLFWTISGEGVAQLLPLLMLLGSGFLVPLPLFPEPLKPLLYALPFGGLVDVPFRLYLGHLPANHAPRLLVEQLFWVAVSILAGRFLLERGLRRAVIQGG